MIEVILVILFLACFFTVNSFRCCSDSKLTSNIKAFPTTERIINHRNPHNKLMMGQTMTYDWINSIGKSLIDIKDRAVETFQVSLENSKKGEPGKRGEIWFFAQITALTLLLGGKFTFQIFPWFGTALFSASMLTFVSGITLVILSLSYLKSNANFYAVPATETLVTEGPYEYMRHPLYGGLILATFGFSVLTNSVERMLFSAILSLILVRSIT